MADLGVRRRNSRLGPARSELRDTGPDDRHGRIGPAVAEMPPFARLAAATTAFTTTQFFLNLRLVARTAMCVMAVAGGRLSMSGALVAGAVCLTYDLVLYLCLRHGLRVPPRLRLALDMADVAGWSVVMGDPIDAPALLTAPLALELALVQGTRALAVPLAVGLATNAALLAAARPFSASPFLWPAFTVLCGLGLARYLELRLHAHLRTALADREAARGQAALAGRHSIAVGADTVVDLITRTWPLLAVPGKAVHSPLAAWRQHLAEQTTGCADYLSAALLRWEQRHNLASPDLARDVQLRAEDGCGSLLLTHRQVARLEAELERLAPRDLVAVRVAELRPLGQRQEVRIGDAPVILPEDTPSRVPSLDPGPSMIALGAVGSLSHCWPKLDAVPLPVGLLLMIIGLAVAWWSHRQIVADGDFAHGRALAAALAFGVVDALVSTLLLGNPTAGGLTRMPFLHFPLFAWPLAVMYGRDLSRGRRVAAVAASAAVFAACSALLPVPVRLADLTALLWPLAFTVGASTLRELLIQEKAAFDQVLSRDRAAAVQAGYQEGRQAVLDLVRQAQEEAERRLVADRARIDPFFLPEIERRLAEVRRRLTRL
ncbi:hypothetical protein [Nonomuraea sp. B19D2]|uniref:hypothetical protein n=1 Tax=Nonomuraea sp. B19D2 TaxID=3159561 RepID=UPI0032DAE59C